MMKPRMFGVVLAMAMTGLLGAVAQADTVETRFATLLKSGSVVSVKSDYILVSKWMAIGVVAYAVISLGLIVYLVISWYRHYNLPLHLVATIGMAAIGTPALTIVVARLGFVELNGNMDPSGAAVASMAIIGIVLIHWKNADVKGKALPAAQPQASNASEPDPLGIPDLSQAIAAAIVDKGMPAAELVVKCLIERIEKIDGEDAYEGLPERLRSGVCNIILNQHSRDNIIQSLNNSAPPASPLSAGTAFTLVLHCRKSASNKIQAFIENVDHVRGQLERYRTRATRS